ncbi:cell envelope integrity protein TolA [Phreatobacter stygius]|uniref:Cell envelope integrity protein TolA n=1 Tax=Phreatobacter stygius TaxID=1940610 RepID=A0A4D7B6N7_9HYPH|nr:cell envelope integrity protein TolA [Phreatobacter stygius]
MKAGRGLKSVALHPQKVGYGVSVGGHVLLLAAALVGFLSAPQKPDEGESVPVEIVSDEPAQSTRGDRRGERTPTPQRVVDRQTPEERQTPDEASVPVARERVQNIQLPPPPTPRPPMPQPPQPEQAEAPPPPAARPAQVAAVQPPQPAPRPTPAVAPEQREDLEAKLAEIQAQQRREDEQRRQEQRQAEQRRREEEQRQAVAQQQRETREREQREAREKAQREARERAQREARERAQREARERAERERQERANARQFDPNSIAARLNTSPTQENDRRQAARTEATGASAPVRTASLGTATGAAARISGREIDAIRAWAERCWEIPISAREGNSQAVRLRVSFNPDGTVTGRPEVQNPRGDSNFQVLANSAVRAVMRCSAEGGVRLPRERYETWREVVLNFDPKEMMR